MFRSFGDDFGISPRMPVFDLRQRPRDSSAVAFDRAIDRRRNRLGGGAVHSMQSQASVHKLVRQVILVVLAIILLAFLVRSVAM